MEKVKILDSSACIHCGACTRACTFLTKYGIDIGDADKLQKLAYHCFLCGRCTEVCPVGIDGREIILDYRREKVSANGDRFKDKGYELLMFEKNHYKYQNYSDLKNVKPKCIENSECECENHMAKDQTQSYAIKSVLFPGCNFPSFYPKTTSYLADLLKEEAGIATVFDCCGKPIAELGLQKREVEIPQEIDRRLRDAGVEEVIMVCPNCYHFLKPKLSIRVVTIYEKLKELGIGRKIPEQLTIFPPCPERGEGAYEILGDIWEFLEQEPKLQTCVQCCGLGGCAPVKEPELAKTVTDSIDRSEKICTYCGTCAGAFARKQYADVEHVLVKILEQDEIPDTAKSMVNRMKTKLWRGKKRKISGMSIIKVL